jgi:exonuclease V
VPDVNGNSILNQHLTPDDMPIIGTKNFAYDDALLNEHVTRTLEWWYGHRDPRGVSLKESRRCLSVPLMIVVATVCLPPISSSCEYESSCEWRERKAVEFRRS